MPSTVQKEYILLTGSSASFTQHLAKPLKDVIKTDLVSITLTTTAESPPTQVFIQSTNLGGAIHTPDNTTEYWRMMPMTLAVAQSQYSSQTFSVSQSRVDSYLDSPRTLLDIDITLTDYNNALFPNVTYVSILVEVERRVEGWAMISSS
jgi:hypothetical protein